MVAAASGDAGAMLFVCAMAAGMWLAGRLRKAEPGYSRAG